MQLLFLLSFQIKNQSPSEEGSGWKMIRTFW